MNQHRDFKPLAPLDVSDADLEAFVTKRGVPTLRAVENAARTAPAIVKEPFAPTSSPDAGPTLPTSTRVALDIPLYLADQLKRRALDLRCSTRFIMLKALRDAGFEINEEDMIADGRRVR